MLRIFKWCRLLYWILIATDSFRLQCPKVISTDYTGQTSCRRVSLRKLNSFTRSKLIFCSTKLIWYGKSLWNLNASSSIPNCSFPSSFCFLFIWSREVSNQWEFEDQRAGKCARRPRYIAFSLPHMVDRSGWHKILKKRTGWICGWLFRWLLLIRLFISFGHKTNRFRHMWVCEHKVMLFGVVVWLQMSFVAMRFSFIAAKGANAYINSVNRGWSMLTYAYCFRILRTMSKRGLIVVITYF